MEKHVDNEWTEFKKIREKFKVVRCPHCNEPMLYFTGKHFTQKPFEYSTEWFVCQTCKIAINNTH